MKRRLIIVALILLGVGVGMFFLGKSSEAPLVVRVIGITNEANGRIKISFCVSNRADRSCMYHLDPKVNSNGVWITPSPEEWSPYVGNSGLKPGEREEFFYSCRRAGTMRLEVGYLLESTSWQRTIDNLMYSVAPSHFEKRQWDFFTTPPFDLSSAERRPASGKGETAR